VIVRTLLLLLPLAPLAWLAGCDAGGDSSAARAAPLPIGLSGPALISALPATRPDARVKATLALRCAEPLPAGSSLVVRLACLDGERLFAGWELRYALSDLPERGPTRARRVPAATPGAAGEAQPLLALPRAQGWFALPLARALPPEEAIVVELDCESTPLPLELDLVAEAVDPAGRPTRLPGSVPIRIVDPAIDWLRVLLPSRAAPGEPIEARVVFMTGLSGPVQSSLDSLVPTGTLELLGPFGQQDVALDGERDARRPHAAVVALPALPAGVHRIRARLRGAPDVVGLSNPVRVGDAATPIWFGQLHAHTVVGGHATGVPTDALRYAREIARLDFVTLSEHRESPWFDGDWMAQLVRAATEPGRFVAFCGFEWTDPDWGHRHLLFRDAIAPPPAPWGLPTLAKSLGAEPGVLVVAHHPIWDGDAAQRRYVWGAPGDVPRQRLAEVYSWHGSSLEYDSPFPLHGNHDKELPREWELDVLSALRKGQRVFLVADSDSHLAKPGNLVGIEWPKGRRYAYQGVTAVAAPRLERDALFDALDRGDVYGTTGARLLLDATRDGGRATLRVAATAPLAAISLRTPTRLLDSRKWDAPRATKETPLARLYADAGVGTYDVELAFDVAADARDEPWIVTVEQHDGHAAWKLLAPPSWSR